MPRILLLFSYHSGHEWEDSIYNTLVSDLKQQVPGSELFLEYMDTKRYNPESRIPVVKGHLSSYPADWFSLIIAVDDNALQFLIDHGQSLYPDTPVVFCGINGYEGMKSRLPAETSGVVSRVNLEDTLLLAKGFIPDLKRIYVITDATPTGEGNRQMVFNQIGALPDSLSELEFRFLSGSEYSTDEMLTWTSGLEKNSIILMTSWYQDKNGLYIAEKKLIEELNRYSAVPVFNMLHIRPGLLGGKVTTGTVQAEIASRIAAEVLSGTPASEIPVVLEDTTIYTVDYKRLRHWGFRMKMVPENSLLLNPSVFYEYRGMIGFTVLIMLILVLLSGALGFAIIKLKNAGSQLIQQKNELYITLKSIGDGVISTDTDARILFMNGVAEKLTGWTWKEAIGRKLEDIFIIHNVISGETVDNPVQKVLESRKIVELANHTVLTSRQGEQYHIADSAAPIQGSDNTELFGVVLVFRDVTEQYQTREELKQNREQLRQAARMEAVGKLAGGISHEFNNLLQIILGYSQILKEGESSRFACDIADTIYKTSLSARELTRQLLLFSRKEGVEKKVLSVSHLMRDLLPMLERLLEENITLESDISLDDDWIYADARQLEQVLINLSVNARDAMSKGGVLRITTENRILPDKIEGLEGSIPRGHYIVISVSDTGDGIDPEILPEIFDPFFTTKEKVKGTGLGLSIVYGIIKQHEGYLSIHTEPSRGTCFNIYLPSVNRNVVKNGNTRAAEIERNGQGMICIAEDDPLVRELTETMVHDLGYASRSFPDGRELLNFLMNEPDRAIDLILMDVVMPVMGGVEACHQIRKAGFNTPVLFSSGYTREKLADLGSLDNIRLMHKPFTLKELNANLKELLSS